MRAINISPRSCVAEIRAEGLRVLVYTVNDPDRAKLLAQWGVDMICTDRIDMLAHDMLSTPSGKPANGR